MCKGRFLQNNRHWLYFGLALLANLSLLVALHFLNRHLSIGYLGSQMQKLRSSRFSIAFISVLVSSLLAMGLVFLIDYYFPGTNAPTDFGSLAALFVSLGGVIDFVYVYCLVQGQGLSRL